MQGWESQLIGTGLFLLWAAVGVWVVSYKQQLLGDWNGAAGISPDEFESLRERLTGHHADAA